MIKIRINKYLKIALSVLYLLFLLLLSSKTFAYYFAKGEEEIGDDDYIGLSTSFGSMTRYEDENNYDNALWIEAEELRTKTVGTAFKLVEDDSASGGKCLQTVNNITNSALLDSANMISARFTTPIATTYYIYARVNCPTWDEDSYWVGLDRPVNDFINGLQNGGSWGWELLFSGYLQKGQHELVIGGREKGAYIDKLCFTINSQPPTGVGGTSSSTTVIPVPTTYSLSITASGNGSASYSGATVRGKTTSFTVNEGTTAKITFSPDNGYRIKSVRVNGSTVTVSNNQYTISSINANTTVSVEFEAIPITTYTLSITASGSGSASYSGSTIRSKTSSFTVNAGSSATITFSPDNGYRIKSVKVNNSTVSVSNNQYTISSINANTTISVEFEAIPVTTYTLSITASGNGSVTYGNTSIRSKTSSFTVNAGTSATITFSPDNGYRIKSVKVNNTTASVSNNQYTISSINANTTVSVEFEAIPVTTYTLSITASGNGSASYGGTTIRSKTNTFTVNAGSSATITFTPDNGYRIKSVKVNNSTVSVSNNQYTISSINANTTVNVEFEAIPPTTYTLSITASGNGSATYNSTSIRDKTSTFTVNEGTSATITFTPDDGYQIKAVKVNGSTVTVSNNEYTISNVNKNTTVEVEFEKNPASTQGVVINGIYYNLINKARIAEVTKISQKDIGEVAIPKSVEYEGITYDVTRIGNYAFSYCSNLTQVLISEGVTSIGYMAFYECQKLASITIPSSIVKIEGDAFYGCRSTTVYIMDLASWCRIVFSGNSSNPANYSHRLFLNGNEIKELVIPNSVTSIGKYAFSGCSNITSITIPNSVTSLGASAFAGCTGLTSVSIPSSINSIGNYTFASCSGLNSITIPNSVTSIGSGAFYRCKSLDSVTIPSSINSVGDSTFYGCSGLSSITIPSSVSKIGSTAFKECSSLSTIIIGSGIKTIELESFGLCSEIEDVYCYAEKVPYTKQDAFKNSYIEYATLHVPLSAINSYKETAPWSSFKEIVSIETVNTHQLTIKAKGNGMASYSGTAIRNNTSLFNIDEGSSAIITFSPDNGYRIKSVKVNDSAVTISNNQYTINNMSSDTTVEVEFEEILQAFSADDVNYTIVSFDQHTIRLAKGSYGITLEVPAKVNYQNAEWTVMGIDNGALANNLNLAAVVWNPDAAFTEQVSNPNLLLYVNQAQYAPSSIKNVVVNGNASSITLTDAATGNNFHCPQAFTAQKITYTHNYSMKTGIGKAQGWETIALPFDVQKVTHESKGEIVSFANWRSGDSKRPFWLMQLSASGWTMATSIKANTPYIISMPNNDEYKSGFLLNGRVTFSAENVNVAKTENLSIANYSDRTFVPTFSNLEKSNDMLALNVVNDIERVTGASTEGSTFERNLRPVHPFEAYMTSTSSTRSIGIDEGMATGIIELITALSDEVDSRIYNLNGQLIKIEEGRSLDEVMRELPAGIYIVNGKKTMIR